MEMDIIDEQLDTLGRAFMGMTLDARAATTTNLIPSPSDYYAGRHLKYHDGQSQGGRAVARDRVGTAALRAKQAEVDKAVGGQKKAIDQFKVGTTDRVLQQARKHAADYLIQALIQSRKSGQIEFAIAQLEDKTKTDQAEFILIEAETFYRGNGLRSNEYYGEGIGILISNGPTEVEYGNRCQNGQLRSAHPICRADGPRGAKSTETVTKATGSVTRTWYPTHKHGTSRDLSAQSEECHQIFLAHPYAAHRQIDVHAD